MDVIPDLQKVLEILRPWVREVKSPEENRLDVTILPEHLKAAAKALFDAKWGYLATITGLDNAPTKSGEQLDIETAQEIFSEGTIEALYHFCSGAEVTTIRVKVPYSEPFLDSICDFMPSATLYERELMEMFGVIVVGTPNRERLLLAEDWPDGVYPLRKSFTGLNGTGEEA
jgi:Ni,Fe-hydrogenase III component G